jgi:hypothetical protein
MNIIKHHLFGFVLVQDRTWEVSNGHSKRLYVVAPVFGQPGSIGVQDEGQKHRALEFYQMGMK